MRHILRPEGDQCPADMPAACLSFSCMLREDTRYGVQREWRTQLAAAVGSGPLAELLRGPVPVRVEWVPDDDGRGGQYEIESA